MTPRINGKALRGRRASVGMLELHSACVGCEVCRSKTGADIVEGAAADHSFIYSFIHSAGAVLKFMLPCEEPLLPAVGCLRRLSWHDGSGWNRLRQPSQNEQL